jgi:hypothetical protein
VTIGVGLFVVRMLLAQNSASSSLGSSSDNSKGRRSLGKSLSTSKDIAAKSTNSVKFGAF